MTSPQPKLDLSPALVVRAYSFGFFPMAKTRRARSVDWYSPDPRAILPLDRFHVPHGLRRRLKNHGMTITLDRDFPAVIRACALPRKTQKETWINRQIIGVYTELHRQGLAHSVEAWQPGQIDAAASLDSGATDKRSLRSLSVSPRDSFSNPADKTRLVGGLYGVALGSAFFGESMFSSAADASKLCLVHLVNHLRARGYTLLDVQMTSPHMEQFGVVEVPREQYLELLQPALQLNVAW